MKTTDALPLTGQTLREERALAREASEEPLISVLTPAHNEEGALGNLIHRVRTALSGRRFEIVIVDDGSTDATWQTVQQLKRRHSEIRALRFTRNFGHQSAILAGLMAARGEAVIMMDSDGQHPPELLPTLLERWRQGHMVVQSVRLSTVDEGVLKRWSSRAFYRVLSLISGISVPPGSADFRLLARPVVDLILRSTGPVLFLRGLIPWLGYEVCYVAFDAQARLAGRSSYTWRRMARLCVDGLMSYTIIPLRLSIGLGLALSGFSFLYLIYIVTVWLTSSGVVPGWASVAGLLSLLGGIQLVMIGVVGEYLGRMFLSNLNRPHFVVREQL